MENISGPNKLVLVTMPCGEYSDVLNHHDKSELAKYAVQLVIDGFLQLNLEPSMKKRIGETQKHQINLELPQHSIIKEKKIPVAFFIRESLCAYLTLNMDLSKFSGNKTQIVRTQIYKSDYKILNNKGISSSFWFRYPAYLRDDKFIHDGWNQSLLDDIPLVPLRFRVSEAIGNAFDRNSYVFVMHKYINHLLSR